jgi:hypothetical protein
MSKYQVQKMMMIVEETAKEDIPVDIMDDVDGINGFKLDYEKLFIYLVKLFKLEDAERSRPAGRWSKF